MALKRTAWIIGGLACGFGLACAECVPVAAQTAISADGEVESTAGGFRFPDGGLQATAFVFWPAPVEDSGQQGCWDDLGASADCSGTGQDGELQRGLAEPTPRFTDNGDGSVTDNHTGLIWLKLANCFEDRTWTQALSDANGLAAGFCGLTDGSVATDWRLPNVKELLSLVDYGQMIPSLPRGHPFTGLSNQQFWTSTSDSSDPGDAWRVEFLFGSTGTPAKGGSLGFVAWPVRGGA